MHSLSTSMAIIPFSFVDRAVGVSHTSPAIALTAVPLTLIGGLLVVEVGAIALVNQHTDTMFCQVPLMYIVHSCRRPCNGALHGAQPSLTRKCILMIKLHANTPLFEYRWIIRMHKSRECISNVI
jgi:hypothetical protein